MPKAEENTICRLATVSGVDMKTAAATTLYTVPVGKTFYPTQVIIRETSASLAGGTSYSFTGWRQAVDLSSMTTLATDYICLDCNNAKYTDNATATNFQITVTTGSTAACTATIDVFGFIA
jgi:ethanolamine utilization microcompartment shell protein EutL